ncbi:glycosyltransferase family 2 protein [Celeribacter sp.]|uniref:glycosyltransferase family 2 protein n=1 Tax=Celeribacter sp. TaxID=1890673 RepID=UPI003A8D7C2E
MEHLEPLDMVVSIINYRTAALTCACLATVVPQVRGRAARVVVVDNASGDGSDDEIADWIAREGAGDCVTLIRSQRNSGFSGGHNQTIEAFNARAYFILNSDAYLREGCIDALMVALEAHPRAGLIGTRLEAEDGTAQPTFFRMPGAMSEMIRAARTGFVTRALRRFDLPLPNPPQSAEIGWASFAAIVVTRQVIEAIGPMDDGYFLYFEDTDYGVRTKRAGFDIAYAPDARVVHYCGGSSPVESLNAARKRLPAYYYASRTRLFYKTHGRMGLLAANLAWHAGRVIAAARVLVGGSYPRANENEARDIWTNFLDPLGDPKAPSGR